jgi:hypothetical protein
VLGNIAAKAVQTGKLIEIAPPLILDASEGYRVPSGQTGLLFKVCLSDGDQAALAIFVK